MKRVVHSIESSWKGIFRDKNKDASLIISTDEYHLILVFDGVSSADHATEGIQLLLKLVKENHTAYSSEKTYDLRSLLMDMNGVLLKSRWTDMQTTICALYLPVKPEESAMISHIGDSRIYSIQDNEILRLTEDHNVPEMPNMLTHCLGMKSLTNSDFYEKKIDINPGQTFMLCTDGIYTIMEEQLFFIVKKYNGQNKEEISRNIENFVLGHNGDDATYVLSFISTL